jgi:hypothetical protein
VPLPLGFWVFSPGAPEVFLRERYVRSVTHCRVLLGVKVISFLPAARELEYSEECWASLHLRRQVFWCYSLNSNLQLSSHQWGIWYFCFLVEKQRFFLGWHSGNLWASLCLREAGFLVPTVLQIATQWNSWVPTLWQGSRSSPMWQLGSKLWSTMGREASWCQQNSKAWSLGFTCMYGSGLMALSSKLRMPMGQQKQQN